MGHAGAIIAGGKGTPWRDGRPERAGGASSRVPDMGSALKEALRASAARFAPALVKDQRQRSKVRCMYLA